MNLTQYAIFEICTECNLGDVHKRCPNKHPGRYANLPHDTPVSDDQIVEIATALYREHGFHGHVGWHYYNEPLMAAERMWLLMDRIDAAVPEATYTLWTNGLPLPGGDCNWFGRFAEIHVTEYAIPNRPIRHLKSLARAMPKGRLHLHRWQLDDRLRAIGDHEVDGPGCNRMFTEFIVDYFGNVHLCCYDWAGIGSIGNVSNTSLDALLIDWQNTRDRVAGKQIACDAPPACVCCKVRSEHIPAFIPEIAADARRSLEESCQR